MSAAPTISLAQALDIFFSQDLHPHLGTSANTIQTYKITFQLFFRFIAQEHKALLNPKTPLRCFDAALIQRFFQYLAEKRRCSPATINVRRAAFCALARSVQRRHPELTGYSQSILAIPSRKTREALVGYFELDELQAIFDAVDHATKDGFRDLVLLRCLYNTGARASEICTLRKEDLQLEEQGLMTLYGKGGKVRTAALWPSTVDLLKAYLKAARRPAKPGAEAYVFISRKGNALTRYGLYRLARRYIERAAEQFPKLRRKEIDPVCSFRHTTATHLLWAGESLTVIQEILGHSSPETTRRYRAVNVEMKRRAIKKLADLRKGRCLKGAEKPAKDPLWDKIDEAIRWLEGL